MRATPEAVLAVMLAASDEELPERLADLCMTAIEDKRAIERALHKAVAMLHEAETRVRHQRTIIADMRARLRDQDRQAA